MNKYKFKIKTQEGKIVREIIYGENEDDVKRLFEKANCRLLRLKLLKKRKAIINPKVNYEQLSVFAKKLSMMLQSGVPLVDALNNIQESLKNTYWKLALSQIIKEIRKGISFSDALEKYPSIFPKVTIMMVKVAEVIGNLGDVMEYLSNFYLKEYRLRQKIRSTLLYPCILVILTIIIFIALIFLIIPRFEEILSNIDSDKIPLITTIIFSFASFFRNYYLYILLGILLIGFIIYNYFRKSDNSITDSIKLKVPIIRTYNKWLVISRFTRSLSMMYNKGISLIDAFNESSIMINNKYLSKKLSIVKENVYKGISLSTSLSSIKFFPPLFIELISVGEKSNNMNNILETLSDYYEKEAESKITKLSQTLEPIIIICIALVVMIVILSIFIPMFSMMDSIMEV